MTRGGRDREFRANPAGSSTTLHDQICPFEANESRFGTPEFTDPGDRRFPRAWLERSVFDIFAEVASNFADKTAIDDGDTDLTFREVHDSALDLACIIDAATERGAPIGIALPFGAAYPVAMLAALAAGRPFVPLDLDAPEERTAQIVKHSQLRAMIVDDETRVASDRFAPGVTQIRFGASGAPARADLVASPADVGLIIYTSGSTGQPKGVYYDQRNLVHRALVQTTILDISADDRMMVIHTPTSARALADIFGALLNGARLFVVDLRRKGLQEVIRVMRRGRITIFFAVPTVFRELLKVCREPEPLTTIRHVALSTERVFAGDIELFRQRFPETAQISIQLGSTEAKIFCHWVVPREWRLAEPILPVGYVLPDYDVRLLDAQGAEVQPGNIGTIVIASHYISLGYWNDEAATGQSFSIRDDGMRVFRSGDLGRFRPDGLLELIGREDRQLKIRGNRVEPQEIEAVLRTYPGVLDAAVIPRDLGETIELVAYIVIDKALVPTSSAIATWLIDRLPDALRPKEFVVLDEIPKLPNFKQDLRRLVALDRSRRSSRKPDLSQQEPDCHSKEDTALHDAVRSLWQRSFGAHAIETDMAWEDAGGDSLKALEFMYELEKKLRRSLPMAALGPRTRPSELISSLMPQTLADGTVSFGTSWASRPTVFYLPGYGGSTLHNMRLVQALANEIEVKVLDLPPIEPSRLTFFEFNSMVDHVLEPIRAAALAGEPIRLLGYSLGGVVAFECARILAAEHHATAFLGIIDAPAPTSAIRNLQRERREQEQSSISLRPTFSRIGTLIHDRHYFLQRLVRELVHRQRLRVLSLLWRALSLIPAPRLRAIFRKTATNVLRLRANDRYRPAPYDGELVLFRATEGPATIDQAESEDLGWSQLCKKATIIQIPGDHSSVMSPTYVSATCSAIVSAVRGNASLVRSEA